MCKSKIVWTFLLFALAGGGAAQAAEDTWDHSKVKGAKQCAECHEGETEVWKETKHSKNYKTFSRDKDAKAIAKRMGVKRIKNAKAVCTSCHYTVGEKKKIRNGVSCESCHGESADWIDVHNDYGGPDVEKANETAAHKKERIQASHDAGMIMPANLYGFARNCLSCHIVPQQELVDKGEHKSGSDFDLADRLSSEDEGAVWHGAKKPDAKRLKAIRTIGYAVELELSARALVDAEGGTTYGNDMEARAKAALKKLGGGNVDSGNANIKAIVGAVAAGDLKAGNAALAGMADKIGAAARKYTADATGYTLILD